MPPFPHIPFPRGSHTVDTDVVVVGAGVIGAAAAWQLAQRGFEVLLLDRFDAGHTHGASHGSSRLFRPADATTRHVRVALVSLALWRELEAQTGAQLLQLSGGVDHGDPAQTALLAEELTAHGIGHRWLTADDAADRWPGLRFSGPVLHQPDLCGRIHADLAVSALTAAAVGHGAHVQRRTRVEAITVPGPDRVRVSTAVGVIRARRVVVAVGAWTAGLVSGLVELPPMRVTQEQPALFPPRAINPCVARDTDWPTVVHHREAGAGPRGGTAYAVADPCGEVKVGFDRSGTVCDPDRRTFVPEPGQLRRLQDYVAAFLPGLDHDRPDPISFTCTAPAGTGFVQTSAGPVVVGAGFAGSAFSVAPAVGRALAELATGAPDRPAPVATR